MTLPPPPAQRSSRWILSAFLACASLATPVRAADAPSLLAKYDFEDIPTWIPNWGAGLGSTYKPATGWKTPFLVMLDQDNPHAGMNSLRFELLEPADKEKIVHGPAIKIEPSDSERKVRIRLFARASGINENGAGVRVLEKDDKGVSIGLLNSKNTLIPIPATQDWVELDAEGTLHSRTASITFMVVANQSDAPATVWIDDVSVELEPNTVSP